MTSPVISAPVLSLFHAPVRTSAPAALSAVTTPAVTTRSVTTPSVTALTTTPATDVRTPPAGLPVARTADPAECGTLLRIDVKERGRTSVLRARGEIDMLTGAQLRTALDGWRQR